MSAAPELSVILAAKNESATVGGLVGKVRQVFPQAEVIVVDDGSSDDTGALAGRAGARVIRHPVSMGNGAAIKAGARHATGHILAFMDADGQHDPAHLRLLLDKLGEGYGMVVAARDRSAQAGTGRWIANAIYNRLAGWMVGHRVHDLTSGMRVAHADRFREFVHLLPNGFSYPTTITMAFFRAGYGVGYVPVPVQKRADNSRSHIRLFRDGARFLLIIFRVATLYSPLKVFVPIAALFFLMGCGYMTYTMSTTGRFTYFTGLLFVTAVLIFLIGLVSEQITSLLYAQSRRDR